MPFASNEPIPPGVVRLVRLAQEGRLASGDRIATHRLGECEVVSIQSTSSILVRCLANDQYYNISGILFEGARLEEKQS